MFNALGHSEDWAPGRFFLKPQILNRKSNSYVFFPFFFCIKNEEKGQGKEIGLSGSLSINLTRKI